MEQTLKMTTKQTRNRVSSDISLCSQEYYKKFVKETGRKDISKKMYTKIIRDVHTKAMLKLLEGRYNIKIPALGLLKITSERNSVVDTFKSNLYKTRIFHDNPHTNGIIYHISFYPQYGSQGVMRMFRFRAMRNYQRLFAQKIFKNEFAQL